MRMNDMTSPNHRPRTLVALAALGAAAIAPATAQEPELDPIGERLVVTASRRAQELGFAPAAMTVIPGADIALAPADDYGDLLRNVPGLNVAQTSVRDINLTGRGSTSTL